jgi:hypothetical protein
MQVLQYRPHHRRLGDEGNDLHLPLAAGTLLRINLLYLVESHCALRLFITIAEDLAKITTPSFPSAFIGNPVSQIQSDMDSRLRGNDDSWPESLILQEALP